MSNGAMTKAERIAATEALAQLKDEPIYHCDRLITYDEIEALRKVTAVYRTLLFATYPNTYPAPKWNFEVKCDKCGKTGVIRTASKSELMDTIAKKRREICDKCLAIEEEEKRRQKELDRIEEEQMRPQRVAEQRQRTKEGTRRFIESYIDPNKHFVKPLSKSLFWEVMSDLRHADEEAVAESINKITYGDFLKTPYWKITAWYAKARADFRCTLCGSKKMLQTHHKTYENHGYEMQRWRDDLICLCHDCHEKFHNITEDQK